MNTNKDIFGKAGKNMPYEVPEGFFDQMDKRLQEATKSRPAKRTHIIPLWKVAGVAAVVVVALISGALIMTKQPLSPEGVGEIGIAKVDTPDNSMIHALNNSTEQTKQEEKTAFEQPVAVAETKEPTPLKQPITKATETKKTAKLQAAKPAAKVARQSVAEVSDPLNLYTPDATDAQSEQMLMDLAEADIFMTQYSDLANY